MLSTIAVSATRAAVVVGLHVRLTREQVGVALFETKARRLVRKTAIKAAARIRRGMIWIRKKATRGKKAMGVVGKDRTRGAAAVVNVILVLAALTTNKKVDIATERDGIVTVVHVLVARLLQILHLYPRRRLLLQNEAADAVAVPVVIQHKRVARELSVTMNPRTVAQHIAIVVVGMGLGPTWHMD